jgi:hypothetical protein
MSWRSVLLIVACSTLLLTTKAYEISVRSSTYAEEAMLDGWTLLDSSDVELPRDLDFVTDQIVGLTFPLNVPQNAIISNAYIQFMTKDSLRSSGSVTLLVYAEGSTTPSAFLTGSKQLSTRLSGNEAIKWSPPDWTVPEEASVNQQTPNISPILQELVMQREWVPGNKVVILIKRDVSDTSLNSRIPYSGQENSDQAPLLVVEYSLGGEEGSTVLVCLHCQRLVCDTCSRPPLHFFHSLTACSPESNIHMNF